MWQAVLERFEQYAPASVMARLALEQALPAQWVDEVFEAHRQRQYHRELMFSTVIELMTLVSLGLRPSLHAAARKMGDLPVSMAALYDKLNRTEPAILRGLVSGSAERLMPVARQIQAPLRASLPGWCLRIVDGNHLPASQKRLAPLRGHRGAALPGHSLVVYDPDLGLVCDIVTREDAYESERIGVLPLVRSAQPGQLWIADRNFCTQAVMQGYCAVGASFIVREHAAHPKVRQQGDWCAPVRADTGWVREQAIEVRIGQDDESRGEVVHWRRIEIELDTPSGSGETAIRMWSNLPASVDAQTIAGLYRKRWRIEGLFGRLESVLHSEITTLGHPRASLLGFTVAVLAYNVVSLLQRAVEQAHREEHPQLEVSTYHLAEHIKSGYEGMMIALPQQCWTHEPRDAPSLAHKLLLLARRILPKQVATSKRGPKINKPKNYVDRALARAHVSTHRLLKKTREERP